MSDLWILGVDDDDEGEAPPRSRRDRRDRRSNQGRRRRKKKRRSPFGVLLSVVVICGLVAGIFYGGRLVLDKFGETPDYQGQGEGTVTIQVKEGDSTAAIATTLVKAGVVKSEKAFNDAASGDSRARSIQPGFYTLHKHMSGANAFDLLVDPAARAGRVTLAEGLSEEQILAQLSKQTSTPLKDLQAAAKDTAALGLPAYAKGRLEGFLFPTTYDIPQGMPPADMLKQMVSAYTDTIDEAELTAGAQALHRTPLEVLTVASLIEKEAITDDFGKIARVLYNRIGDTDGETLGRLQLDSTVNYALHRNNISVTQVEIDKAQSPYNTYLHAGLPPGPISNPGEQAIQAALNPTPGPWLYFVKATKDGHSAFATTFAEHKVNVDKAKAAGVF